MSDIRQLTRQKLVALEIDLGDGETVSVKFDRNKITPSWIEQSQVREDEADPFALPRMLAAVLVSWDVTDEGEVFPPTAENLAQLSFGVQGKLLEEIIPASLPTRAEGEVSSAPSSPSPPEARQDSGRSSSEKQPAAPNGPLTSESPAPSASPSPT